MFAHTLESSDNQVWGIYTQSKLDDCKLDDDDPQVPAVLTIAKDAPGIMDGVFSQGTHLYSFSIDIHNSHIHRRHHSSHH